MTELTDLLDRHPDDAGSRTAWDQEVLGAVGRIADRSGDDPATVRGEMDTDRSWVLVGWAESQADGAVRASSREQLVLGLVGLTLFDPQGFDSRDAALVVPLFVVAARAMELDPDEVLNDAAARTDDEGARWLSGYLPSASLRLPETHTVRGSGTDFRFDRVDPGFDVDDLMSWLREGGSN